MKIMNDNIEKCKECGEKFHVVEHKLAMPGTKEIEDIECPYCNHTITRSTSGSFRITALSEEDRRNLDL